MLSVHDEMLNRAIIVQRFGYTYPASIYLFEISNWSIRKYVKSIQSYKERQQNDVSDDALVP